MDMKSHYKLSMLYEYGVGHNSHHAIALALIPDS